MNARHLDDESLIAYALEELDPSRRAELEAHLAECPACAQMAGALRGALGGFREAAPPDPPAEVLMQLLAEQARVRERRHPARAWWRAPVAATAVVAATAMIFLGGFWFGQQRGGVSPAFVRGGAMRADGSLPAAPRIAFRATPPMDAWLSSSGDSAAGWLAPAVDVGDSL